MTEITQGLSERVVEKMLGGNGIHLTKQFQESQVYNNSHPVRGNSYKNADESHDAVHHNMHSYAGAMVTIKIKQVYTNTFLVNSSVNP